MGGRVVAAGAPYAERGALFVDPRTADPYLVDLGEVKVEKQGAGADASEPQMLERKLYALRQNDDGSTEELSLDQVTLLQGAPDVPPGAVPLAARAVTLRADVATRLDREAGRLADVRREVILKDLPDRLDRIGRNFKLKLAEVAKRRRELMSSEGTGPGLAATKQEQRELLEQRGLALEWLDAEPARIVPGKTRFLAHALALPPTGQDDVEAFDARVEEIAMRIATEWERSRGSAVADVSKPEGARTAGLTDFPGFDLLATGNDGRRRHIEVKGRAEQGEIWMEINEWRAACHLEDDYWLYVVYDCATAAPKLKRVRNPFAKLVGQETARLRISVGEVMGAAEKTSIQP